MAQFNIADAKAHFSELVDKALLGEEIVIARGNKPLLKLVPVDDGAKERRPGSGRGKILFVAPDFDQTPEDFSDYT